MQVHILPKQPHITKPTHTHIRTLRSKLKQTQYKIHTKWNSHNTIKYPQYKAALIWTACHWYDAPKPHISIIFSECIILSASFYIYAHFSGTQLGPETRAMCACQPDYTGSLLRDSFRKREFWEELLNVRIEEFRFWCLLNNSVLLKTNVILWFITSLNAISL